MAYTRLITLPTPSLHGGKNKGKLALARPLIGNNNELADVRLINSLEAPTHSALATTLRAICIIYVEDVTSMFFLISGHEEGGEACTSKAAYRQQ